MKRKNRYALAIILLISISLTGIGYWLDNDPSVGFASTLFDVIMMTAMLFVLISGFYFGIALTFKRLGNPKI